ncbi:MAG: hypothetical protein LBU70_04785 [Chitinispirillales bacterium]|jgi:hypothetical protein|nr:hypothetical protein [Chitinispirillales bacterium]
MTSIKAFNAFTKELDNPEVAVREILEQLKPEENMLKNTIGVVHFYHDFAEDDIWQTFADAMPFELVGGMSSYIGATGQSDDAAVSVTMFTSDVVRFAVETIEDIDTKSTEQMVGEVTRIYKEFCAEEKPKLIVPFTSPMPQFSGDDLVSAVNAFPDPVPLFGMLVYSIEGVPDSSYVVGNGKISLSMCALMAVYGDIEPKFYMTTSFDVGEGYGEAAEITDVEGAMLKSINGIPALKYLKEQGIASPDDSGTGSEIAVIPAVLTCPDGTTVARAFLKVVEGTDYILAAGIIKKGSKILFSILDGDKTVASTDKLIKELDEAKKSTIYILSCAARAWSLGSNIFAEMQQIADYAKEYEQKNNSPLRYSIAYTGGEICPIRDSGGKYINTLHNYTLIACAFD